MKIKLLSPLAESDIPMGTIFTLDMDTQSFISKRYSLNVPAFIQLFSHFDITEPPENFIADLYDGFVSNEKVWYENYLQ